MFGVNCIFSGILYGTLLQTSPLSANYRPAMYAGRTMAVPRAFNGNGGCATASAMNKFVPGCGNLAMGLTQNVATGYTNLTYVS